MDNMDLAQRAYAQLSWIARGCWLNRHRGCYAKGAKAGIPQWADSTGTVYDEQELFLREFIAWCDSGTGPGPA